MKRVISLVLVLSVMVTGCTAQNVPATSSLPENAALKVALYEYVPDMERFKSAVRAGWEQIEPDIELEFVSWDCYDSAPPEDLDVMVYDAIFFQSFVAAGSLLPIPDTAIDNKADLLGFAVEACTVNGAVYSIPQIICTNLLFYRDGDTAVAGADTVDELYDVIGARVTSDIIPGANEGLLIDMSGGTTKLCMYLDGQIDHSQTYSDFDILPDPDNWDVGIISRLQMLLQMAGEESAYYWPDDNDSYIRAKWLQQGNGRAYIGFTEAMSNMGEFADDVSFKLLSSCEHDNIPLFFGDVVGVNASVPADMQESAIKLANLIAAEETMVTAISPDADNQYPQYLLPARAGVYDRMSSDFPIYGELDEIAMDPDNKLFLAGADIYNWLETAKESLEESLDND